ncbi:peptide/nickel transport system substrate-binding protein [Rathayibacter oskolensis]|uniref:Peptide/nickel transport system substrate-binding protein n=1 Tax=Rathayibacter oskolensis TaxID=1891671 RepID=A0A1X7NY47_9MICO|nr:ABC transporter substrate-binding protein [Rathayibacter oskolensis]SMH43226.1 peptide/nickel transport system substrate-binding protein [Rathayibacter oskolensis]
MHRPTRPLAVAAVAAATALVLSGCSGGSSATDTFVIVTAAQPSSFSYETSATGYEAAEFFMNTGATLIRNPYIDGSEGESVHQDLYDFEPVLAESYEVSDDQLTYTFDLNTDAVSTAGNTLTADDVIFSIQRKFEVETSIVAFISAPSLTSPDQVTKIDEDTVQFTVAEPGYGFTLLSLLANTPYNIYDSTALKEHATDDDPYAVTWSQTNANFGYGAYSLSDYTPGEQMVYEANPGFALGEPTVKRIVQRVVADAGQRSNLVSSGDAQIATQLRPADQATLASDDSAQVFTVPTNAFVYMPLLTTAAPFDDVRVRRALAAAIPSEQIMSDVYQDRLSPISTILDASAPGFSDEGLVANTTDVEAARALLAEAGYSAENPVEFTLTVNNAVPDLQETAVQIQTAARDAGFEITIDPVNSAAFQEGLAAKTFQASMGRDYAVVQSPPYVLSLFYTPGSPINWPDFDDAALNDAIAAGNAAGDPLGTEAGAEWNAAQQVLQAEMPTIYIGYVQPLNAFATGVEGYAFRSDNVIDYSELAVAG